MYLHLTFKFIFNLMIIVTKINFDCMLILIRNNIYIFFLISRKFTKNIG